VSAEGEAFDPVAGALAARLRALAPEHLWTVDRPGEQGYDDGPAIPRHCYVVRGRARGRNLAAILAVEPEFAEQASREDVFAQLLAVDVGRHL
jgi:hypothetical protein